MEKRSLVMAALIVALIAVSTQSYCATIDADLNLVYQIQYANPTNGYNNQYFGTWTNTGETPIFALFINPEGSDLNYGSDTNGGDNWIMKQSNGHNGIGWVFFSQIGEHLKDVPDDNGWIYNLGGLDWICVVYNSTHNDVDHTTTDPLEQGESIDFIYTVKGVEKDDHSVPALTYMVAGYDLDTGEVVTAQGGLPVPEPGALTAIFAVLLSLNRRRK
jgi:hypothetical protein